MLSRRQRIAMQTQWFVSWFFAPIYIFTVRVIFWIALRYRYHNLAAFRSSLRTALEHEFASNGRGPVLICANHLTMIDSVVINISLFSIKDYFLNWRFMPWNMPEKKNFSRSLVSRILCYLGKCVPVERGGTVQSRELVINKFKYLLSRNEFLCIFPEGTRSRTGCIKGSSPTYTVGQFAQEHPNMKILCLYARGENQHTWSYIPAKNERFRFLFRFISPTTQESGRRAHKEIAESIIHTLGELEDQFFEDIAKIQDPSKPWPQPHILHHGKS